jgi:ubiquinone/menaquinone biosynthesis C-methylase UbiE
MTASSEKFCGELAFWQSRLAREGALRNDHFEYFYTTHFGLDRACYRGKRVLDLGCGPRGSLEWASEAALRLGLDPLAEVYRSFGTARHAMRYVAAGAEQMPFPDGSFDVVCSLNSLDHVDDLGRSVSEIVRVVAPGAYFLLISDIHQHPTTLEPSAYSWDVVDRFQPDLLVVEQRHYEYAVMTPEGYGNMYGSIQEGIAYDHNDLTERYGILSVKFRKL